METDRVVLFRALAGSTLFSREEYALILQFLSSPLTNRVRGPYCKLRPAFFPIDLWPKREARGPLIEGEKQGSVILQYGPRNEVSKIFLISLYLEKERAIKKF